MGNVGNKWEGTGDLTGTWAGDPAAEGGQPVEDRALKLAAQFFGEVLMPRLGIAGKVRRIAPTEQIHLEMKAFFEDFNFEMEDGTWRHFEFESDEITEKDLMRFRSYEAVTSFYYGVEVVTCVICTARVKSPRREIRQGINRYRVQVVHLKDRNADQVIRTLEGKSKTGSLGRGELAELLLTPLMSGELEISERIKRSIRLIQGERETLGKADLLRMESVLYAFAMKFLSRLELNNMQEVFGMTELGQMLENRRVEKGIKKGLQKGLQRRIEEVKQTCRELGVTREYTQNKIISQFQVSEDMAKGYLEKYWND